MKLKKELIRRDIAGDTILVPAGTAIYQSNGLFVLNEVAAFIWDILPQKDSEEEIVAEILKVYDTTADTAAADTAEFLDKLREMDIID